MNTLVEELKKNDQDFEFYPTTKEILKPIVKDLLSDSHISLLDVGAGNGNVFKIIEELTPLDNEGRRKLSFTKYAIEKSSLLLQQLKEDVFVLGTDFETQTFIDKKVDVIFCNPPYSQYEIWAEKIIREANAKYIYLVIPQRWKENKKLLDTIKKRTDNAYKILGSFDFINSEYRQARAKVDIIKISLLEDSHHYSRDKLTTDPFDIWFNDVFKIKADQEKAYSYEESRKKAESLHDLVQGQNLIERLEELYRKDLDHLLNTYKTLETLDSSLLKELDINLNGVKEGLKVKIKGLKNLYWEELFNNLDKLTARLTSKSRKSMLLTLTAHTNIDFTINNAYAVVIWAIKNTNKYIDAQLCEVYKGLTEPASIKNYKSNKRMLDDNWRYCNNPMTHYTLDYRIVSVHYQCFNPSTYGDFEFPNGLHKSCHDFLDDLIVIAKNLGFDVYHKAKSFIWGAGETNDFYYYKNNEEKEIFMSVKAYKNGNIHLKINQDFMKAFNIEAARLNKWVKSPQELHQETGIEDEDINRFFNNNQKIDFKNIKLLGAGVRE